MSDLSKTVADGFISAYREYARRVHTLSEDLSEQQFWTKPYPYGNSFGHLTLHLIGNLSYYIGAQIADTGYVRDREREFNESNPPTKQEVLRRLDDVVQMVIRTVEAQTAESWSAEYSATGAEHSHDRFSILLQCAAHFHHHVGQMIYIAKEYSK